jgi:subtilase family serine protease
MASEDRIQGPLESARSIPLTGSLNPRTLLANDLGAMEPGAQIDGVTLVLAPSGPQRDALERFLEKQRDPSSPDYRNWLTPEQYGERFGLSENDLAVISSWLQSEGFVIDQRARARNWITFSGTAAQIAQTFRTELHHVEMDREMHFTNTTEIWIPPSLAGIVGSIRGLDDFRPKPQHAKLISHPEFDASGGAHFLGPGDLATIYDIQALYNGGFDGTGQKLAIAGQTDVSLTDLRAFRAQFNLPAKDPQMVLFGADPGTNQDDQIEASLDLELSGAVARNAAIVYVYSRNVFDSLQYAIDQNLAPVISVSYGGCEWDGSTSFRTLAQQANAQGITWMNAAGDSGAAGCDLAGQPVATRGLAATFPADIPEVTAVGGTEFNELNEAAGSYWSPQNSANFSSALSYIPETAWNDTPLGSGLVAGGGAPSLVYAKPWWQTGPGVPNDQARDVPDVSLAASGQHDGYMMYVMGELMALGGTSAASPSFAGIVSILNQYLAAKGTISKPGLGNINPDLYNLAQNTTGLFHDIVTGNNVVPCAAGSKGCVNGSLGYTAGPGYDLATGLGSVDAFNLVTKWNSVAPVVGTAMTLAATPDNIAASASVQLTATLTVMSGGNVPAGSVTFSLGNTALGTAVLNGSSTTTATAALTVRGARLAWGVNRVTATWTGNAGFGSSTASANVTVTAASPAAAIFTSMVVTATPAAIAPSASTVLTAVVTAVMKQASGANVPAGTVAFVAGTTALGTANLVTSASGAVATLIVKGASLAAGVDTITAGFTATGGFGSSSSSVVVTVVPPASGTAITATVNPANIAASGTAQVTAFVKPLAGNTVPTGTVTFSVGNNTLGAVQLSNGSATLALQGGSLATGSNSVVATYGGNGNFSGSTATPVTVIVAPPPIPTNTVLSASPSMIAQNSTTVLTATVKAAPGSGAPTGSVLFMIGNALLGDVAVTAAGTAALTVQGISLMAGGNTVAASYVATGNFANSSGLALVNVTPSPTITTTAVSVSPGTRPSTIVLTVTVKAASGALVPTGSVTFALGSALLGSAVLSPSGFGATGTLTLSNGILAAGNNTIVANYAGNTAFSRSTASIVVSKQ